MNERDAMMLAIIKNPAEDTVRLVYADWLEENGDPERAEFIRVQCELSGVRHGNDDETHCINRLAKRANELLDAHPDWRQHKCPECRGQGGRYVKTAGGFASARLVCQTCNDTKDLLKFWKSPIPGSLEPQGYRGYRNPQFARGFVDSVDCRLEELGKEQETYCQECNGLGAHPQTNATCGYCKGKVYTRQFIPSPWAVAVVKALPVTRFVLTNMVPLVTLGRSGATSSKWRWWRERPGRGAYAVMPTLFDMIEGGEQEWVWEDREDFCLNYPTTEAAIDSLARAAGRLVHQHVYAQPQTA